MRAKESRHPLASSLPLHKDIARLKRIALLAAWKIAVVEPVSLVVEPVSPVVEPVSPVVEHFSPVADHSGTVVEHVNRPVADGKLLNLRCPRFLLFLLIPVFSTRIPAA